jgi:hypothetical protein
MKQIVFFETFAYDRLTCNDLWMGTAPLETIEKHGLAADLSHPLCGDEKLCINGWGFKSPEARARFPD